VRALIQEMVEQYDQPTIVDMEAGLEHLSRGTIRYVDCILIIIEPYFKSMETGAQLNKLAKELEIKHVYCVANKVRSFEDEEALATFCSEREMELLGMIPNDDTLIAADRANLAPLDYNNKGLAVMAISELSDRLMNLEVI
jgi:CO dehydrogenase maturation factor